MSNVIVLPSVQASEERYRLLHGDVMAMLQTLGDNSVDSVVTDPPYELGFMGKSWDATGIANDVKMWQECLRVLKPGGHLLSFGGSRTYHRMACAIEDAGFQIRDQIMWVYGQGFPKSMDVSKAFDKAEGAEREVIGERKKLQSYGQGVNNVFGDGPDKGGVQLLTAPAPKRAKQWEGWGTALKPSHEPLVLARKPLIGTLVQNITEHGVGAININGCRVGNEPVPSNKLEQWSGFGELKQPAYTQTMNEGRWPGNLIHDGSDEVLEHFPNAKGQQGESTDAQRSKATVYGDPSDNGKVYKPRFDLSTSAARFFYCSKANKKDRNEGCEHLGKKTAGEATDRVDGSAGLNSPRAGARRTSGAHNHHPTVKPTELMQYLCRLITPPNGIVLDPFMGSGSTGKAALKEGFRFIGIERESDYIEIAQARIQKVAS